MKNIIVNKKGNVFDIIFYIFVIFGLGLSFVIYAYVYSQIDAGFQASTVLTNQSKQISSTQNTRNPVLFDNVIFFIVVGLMVLTAVSAFFIRTHPIFFFISLFALVIIVFFAALLSNVFTDIMSDPQLSGTATQFTKTTYVMDHLPIIAVVFGGIIFVVLFAKLASSSGGGGSL